MKSTTFTVQTDQTGFTFASVDDAPYWVTDHLEANHVHAADVPTPAQGETVGPFTVEYDPDAQEITGVQGLGA